MRGRLINPFLAEIARLDTVATAVAGYDPDFRSTKITYPSGVRTSTRVELTPIKVPCQVEDNLWQVQRQTASGNSPDSKLAIVLHFSDLERLSLVDPVTKDALFRVNDRLVGFYDYATGELVQLVRPDSPMFATEVRPMAFGIGKKRNLLYILWEERPQGLTT